MSSYNQTDAGNRISEHTGNMEDLRVLIVDRNRFFEYGLKGAIDDTFLHVVIGVPDDIESAAREADIVIDGDGVRYCADTGCSNVWLRLRDRQVGGLGRPDCRCYAGTLYRTDSVDTILAKLVQAIQMREQFCHTPGGGRACEARRLTLQERRVMRLIGYGMTLGEVARILDIHPKTVSAHKCTVMRKLGLRRKVHLFHWLRQSGLLNVRSKR